MAVRRPITARGASKAIASRYSRENTRAYRRTYPDEKDARPVSAEAILALASDPSFQVHESSRARAEEDATLLHYNAISNDGKDYATRETLCGLLAIVS